VAALFFTLQQGQALLVALVFVLIITVVGLSFAALYSGRVRQNAAYVNGYTAQYIAEAGVNRFLWVLNSTEGWGNKDQYDFLSHPSGTTYYFSGYYQDGQGYYYLAAQNKIDAGVSSTPDAVQVTCTGWLKSDPGNTFTIQAELAVQQFTQNVLFSDYMKTSPDGGSQHIFFASGDNITGPVYTNDVFLIDSSGGAPAFNSLSGANEPVKEALHYGSWPDGPNDGPYSTSGLSFTSLGITFQYQPGNNNNGYYLATAGASKPTGTAWPPQPGPYLPMRQASDLAAFAQSGGYYFKGRTSIYLNGSTMNVVTYDNDPDSYPPDNTLTAGHSYYGYFHVMTGLPLPPNGVIYVDGQTDSTCDGSGLSGGIVGEESSTPVNNGTNYWYVSGNKSDNDLYNGRDYKFTNDMGNVFVYGTLKGQLTIGAANNIYICGSDPTQAYPSTNSTSPYPHLSSGGVRYVDAVGPTCTDMLGLVAGNYAMFIRYDWPQWPTNGTSGNPTDCKSSVDYYPFTWENTTGKYTNPQNGSVTDDLPDNPTIDAVVMASGDSFTLEGIGIFNNPLTYPNSLSEDLGTLTLYGSLIEEYRGILLDIQYNNNTCYQLGYSMNYNYDTRLLYETPPHFLQPSQSGWGVLNWKRIPTPTSGSSAVPATCFETVLWGNPSISGNGTGTNGLIATAGYGQSLKLNASVTQGCPTMQWSVTTWSYPHPTNPVTYPMIDPYSGYLYDIATAGTVTVEAESADTSTPISTTGTVTVQAP
jgi:hypothetical protein